jgi:putative ABC transport system permease protein
MSDERRLSDDIDAEIADHIARRVRELVGTGVSHDDAHAQARAEFGDFGRAKRELLTIDTRISRRQRPRLWSGLGADMRTASRRLAGQAGTSGLTIVTMALAIGVAAAVFSIVDQLILRPPPFAHADRLVDVWHLTGPAGPGSSGGSMLQPRKVLGWQQQPAVFERVEAYAGALFDLTGEGTPARTQARIVSLGLFDMLGIKPFLGRTFASDEGAPGSEKVVMLGHAFWRTRFGGSPDALGARLVLNDEPYTVIGVLPRNTMLLTDDEPVWLPFDLRAWIDAPRMYNFHGVARLAPGMNVETARESANRVAEALSADQPLPGSWYLGIDKKNVAAVPPQSRTALFVLLGAVTLLLLIACVNATSLTLGQLLKRQREIELRAAIGASRWRLMRETLVETLLIASASGAVAIAVAYLTLDVLLAVAPESFVFRATRAVEIDLRVLAVMAGATLGAGLLVGLMPALRSSRVDLSQSLRDAVKGSARGLSFSRGIGVLVVLEVALSMVVLVGAALMSRTLAAYYALDPGFDVDKLVTTRIALPSHRYPTEHSRREFFDALDARLLAQPGIEGSAYAWGIPPSTGWGSATPQPEGGEAGSELEYAASAVSPAYFETTGTRLLAGRPFMADESEGVAILSESFARLLWPDGTAVGRRFRDSPATPWITVVGVARNVETRFTPNRQAPYWYFPYAKPREPVTVPSAAERVRSYASRSLIVRAADPSAVIPAIRNQIHAIDPTLPVEEFTLGSEIYAEPFAQQRFLLIVMTVLSAMAVLLVALGIFGVLSQAVTRRRREIGIRVALGAGHARLIRMLVGRGLVLAIAGAALGTAASMAGARMLESLLFGVSPFDAVSFAAVVVLILLVALVACWWPTRRALAVEPTEVLRSE